MKDHDYTALGLQLDAGSWAEWVSGVMSFAAVCAALLGYWIVHRQRQRDERNRERQIAESVWWKILRVFNETLTIAKHLKSSLDVPTPSLFQPFQFMRIRPLGVPSRPPLELTQDEITLLLKTKAIDILMELNDAILRYDSIRFAMNEYKSRHEALFALMPTPVAGTGTIFTHELTPEEHGKIWPYAKMLDSLIDSIIDLTGEGVDKGKMLVDAFPDSMKAYYGTWHLGTVGDINEGDLTVFRSCELADRP